jgi:UDP-N-acetylmuramoyl-L-alanyl-D-glutamate--2,6-diaminopimelate ligase
MLRSLKITLTKFLKNVFGEKPFLMYHKVLAKIAARWYGYPSKSMLVVAVTGTKGKTSTLNFLWHVLTAGGYKVGLVSTANIKIGNEELMNWYHMTMPGRFLLQKLLARMRDEGCDIALVEVTSEGIKNSRHIGLSYDFAVFTNIFPEHLDSHGNSFEKYRDTKAVLFKNLAQQPQKTWHNRSLPKVAIVNADNDSADTFLHFSADKHITYGFEHGNLLAENISQNTGGVEFTLNGLRYHIPLIGVFNIYNALPAIAIAQELQISPNDIVQGLQNCVVIPGRMEIINEGQDFTAIVDYAHEGVSFRLALEAAQKAKKTSFNKVITVYGAEGGGRDLSKRVTMSKVASELADYVIVTLSDPFDADPQEINDDLVAKLERFGMKKGEKVFDYVDRREGIKKAVELAQTGDVILFASKGAEQTIMFKDKIIPWDDREEVRGAIKAKINVENSTIDK